MVSCLQKKENKFKLFQVSHDWKCCSVTMKWFNVKETQAWLSPMNYIFIRV